MSTVRIKNPPKTVPDKVLDTFPIETIAIDALHPHPRNFRKHPDDQIEHLMKSITANGFYRNVVIALDNTILAGHGTVQAAKRLGRVSVPCVRLPLSPDSPAALKVLAGDNLIEHLAEDDDRLISEILKEIYETEGEELLGTGFDEKMLANLVFVTRPRSEIADMDEASQWVGMPEYGEPEGDPMKIIVSFRNEDDRAAFADLLGQTFTPKTKSIWYPAREKEDYASVRFE